MSISEDDITAPKSTRGRKPLQQGVETVPVMIKMTAPQRDKLQRLGGAPWVRARIDKAKEPDLKE